jgi:hypothetical protein
MFKIHRRFAVFLLGFTSVVAVTSTTFAASPDAGLFAQYDFPNDFSSVYFTVCGSLPQSEGCYGSGSFGPFGHVGAMLEGDPATDGDSVERAIYIIDVAGGKGRDEVILYHYLLIYTITDGGDAAVTTKLTRTVSLPLVGGKGVRCSVAGNSHVVVIGTDQSTQAVMLTKGSLATQTIGGFSNAPTVTSITADDFGFISVSFGGGSVIPGFVVIGPTGAFEEDGGGGSFLVSTSTGLSTKDVLPDGDFSVTSKLNSRPVTLHASPSITR